MIDRILCGTAALALLSACGGTTTGGGGGGGGLPVPTTAPASASTGYAPPNSTFAINDGTVFSGTVPIQTLAAGGGVTASGKTVTMTWANAGLTSMNVVYDGQAITLTGGPTVYTGTNASFPNGLTFTFEQTTGGPVVSMWEISAPSTGSSPTPANPGDTGFMFMGHNTDPTEIANLPVFLGSNTATYTGNLADLRVVHDEGGGSYGFATATNGAVNLTADFTANTISGTISGFSGQTQSNAAYAIGGGTTINISGGQIGGNAVNGNISVTGSSVGMSGTVTGTMEGMFYGQNGTKIGGTFSGTGTTSGSSNSATLYGGFLGQR